MTIEEIRRMSLEYAKGHVKTGPAWRGPRVNLAKERRAAAHREFKHSIGIAVEIPRQTDAYKTNPPGELPPW